MALLIKVGGKNLVAGLNWLHPEVKQAPTTKKSLFSKFAKPEAVQRKNSASVEKTLIKQSRAVMAAGSIMSVWGFLTASDKRGMGKLSGFAKAYSLAEMFSSLPELPVCAIFIAKVPNAEDLYVMCTAINGHPAPGAFDIVVTPDKIERTLQDWEEQLRSVSGRSPVLYGTWSKVANQLTVERVAQLAVACRPIRTVGADTRQFVAIFAVLGLGLSGYWFYEDYQKEQARKRAIAMQQQRLPAAVYAQALGEQWPTHPWGSLARVRSMLDKIGAVPQKVGGFKISTDVQCDVLASTCKFAYRKEGDATFLSFKEAIGGRFVPTSFGQDGMTVEVLMTMTGLPESKPPNHIDLGFEETMPLHFWPVIQKLPATLVQGAMMGDYKLFPAGLAISEAAVPDVVRTVGVVVTFPLWARAEMPPSAGVFQNAINWKALTVGSANASVKLTGELYARKKNS